MQINRDCGNEIVGGEDARERQFFGIAVPLSRKRSSKASDFGASNRTDRHAIRLCRRLNTCLFRAQVPSNPRDRQKPKNF